MAYFYLSTFVLFFLWSFVLFLIKNFPLSKSLTTQLFSIISSLMPQLQNFTLVCENDREEIKLTWNFNYLFIYLIYSLEKEDFSAGLYA